MLNWKWIMLDDYEESGENGRWTDRWEVNTHFNNIQVDLSI